MNTNAKQEFLLKMMIQCTHLKHYLKGKYDS